VRAQDSSEWQAVVCDDGPDDEDVAGLVASLGDSRIRYVRNPGDAGIARSWNQCLAQAGTELVTLLHADDRLLPGYVRLMLGLARRHPDAAALCCEASIMGDDGRPRFSFPDAIKRFYVPRGPDPLILRGEVALRALMAGNFIMCPTLCYRMRVLADRRFEERWRQVLDLQLTTRLLLEDQSIVYARTTAFAYRRHAQGTTQLQSESRVRFDEEWDLFREVAEQAEARGWARAAQTARRATILRLHMGYRALRALLVGDLRGASSWLRRLGEGRP
jgi:glycosyltransferase involved in cell wall biosynthesis